MAVDILGDEIVAGEFIIQIRTRTIIPLYCYNSQIIQGIGVNLQFGSVRISNTSKLVKVSRGAMERMLLRNPLPVNLYTAVNRSRRQRVSARYVIELAQSRQQRANAFYRTFVEHTITDGILNEVLNRDRERERIRPLLALPEGVAVPPTIIMVPPTTITIPNFHFINTEGQLESVETVDNIDKTSKIKSNKQAKSRQPEIDLDFD